LTGGRPLQFDQISIAVLFGLVQVRPVSDPLDAADLHEPKEKFESNCNKLHLTAGVGFTAGTTCARALSCECMGVCVCPGCVCLNGRVIAPCEFLLQHKQRLTAHGLDAALALDDEFLSKGR
jgi:hypothetical protein